MGCEPRVTQASPYPFGLTRPLSLRGPLAADLHQSVELVRLLRAKGAYETAAGALLKERVLAALNALVAEWIFESGLAQGLEPEEARAAGGKIFTFGSYRLGVCTPGSDVDALCVCPRHVSREAFFTVFASKLSQDPRASQITPIPEAYTPVLKFNFLSTSIDLLFARLPLKAVPQSWVGLHADRLLLHADERTARSLNGSRVADQILQLVPNTKAFKTALRFVRLWAAARGVYSNVCGYLGGISWAILTARCCQLFPNLPPSQLVQKFFKLFTQWTWNKSPVCLCKITEYSHHEKGLEGLAAFKVWNPHIYPQVRKP